MYVILISICLIFSLKKEINHQENEYKDINTQDEKDQEINHQENEYKDINTPDENDQEINPQ